MSDSRGGIIYQSVGEEDSTNPTITTPILTLSVLTMGPVRTNMTENSNKRRVSHVLRASLYSTFVLSSIIVRIGCGLNDQNLKYAKTTATSTTSCKQELFIMNVPDSQLCCEKAFHNTDWVCVASFGSFDCFFTSLWALFIPLTPFIATVVSDIIVVSTDATATNNWILIKGHIMRFGLYAVMILYRMVSI